MECVRFVERLDAGARFDGIVLDPPRGCGGSAFWSARSQSALIAAASRCSGRTRCSVCRNDRSAR
jgi:hypothetical protein